MNINHKVNGQAIKSKMSRNQKNLHNIRQKEDGNKKDVIKIYNPKKHLLILLYLVEVIHSLKIKFQ